MVINDNNNFAPSLFRSLCEFVGDCFGPRYFSSGAALPQNFSSGAALPQKNTSVQNNHLRFHTMTSKKMVRSYYCLNKFTKSGKAHTLSLLNQVSDLRLLMFVGRILESVNTGNYLLLNENSF